MPQQVTKKQSMPYIAKPIPVVEGRPLKREETTTREEEEEQAKQK